MPLQPVPTLTCKEFHAFQGMATPLQPDPTPLEPIPIHGHNFEHTVTPLQPIPMPLSIWPHVPNALPCLHNPFQCVSQVWEWD